MFALTLLFLIFTNAQYISNSSGLYIWDASLSEVKSLILPETIINIYGEFNLDTGLLSFYINKVIMKSFNDSIPKINYVQPSSILRINNFEYYEGTLNIYYYSSLNKIGSLVLHTTLNKFKNNINYFGIKNEIHLFDSINTINIINDLQEEYDENNYYPTSSGNYIEINRKTNLSEILDRLNYKNSFITLTNDFIIDTESNSSFVFIIREESNLTILENIDIDSIILQSGYLNVYKNDITIRDLHSSYDIDEFLNIFYLNDNFNSKIII